VRLLLLGFPRNLILGTCIEICREIPVWLKSVRSIGHLTWRRKYVWLLQAALYRHKALSLYELVSDSSDSRGGMNIIRTRAIVTYYMHRLSCLIVYHARVVNYIQRWQWLLFDHSHENTKDCRKWNSTYWVLINLVEITKNMRPCSRIYYCSVP